MEVESHRVPRHHVDRPRIRCLAEVEFLVVLREEEEEEKEEEVDEEKGFEAEILDKFVVTILYPQEPVQLCTVLAWTCLCWWFRNRLLRWSA